MEEIPKIEIGETMGVQLVVAGGNKAGQVIPISVPKFLIGRADDCNLKPRSELISRYHCAIIVEDGYVAVRDLGSKNGVFINGTRVATEQELQHEDKLSVGPLEFFVHLTVAVKEQKKPKIESVSDAVSRTVEIQSSNAKQDNGESEIADWLSSSGEVDADQETKTIDVSDMLESLREHKEAMTDNENSQPKETPQNKTETKPETSRDVAANLLKNFFKGGR
ncbi:MAG: FHA domain-containing protein [Planctomycetaceae bacterium]|jgi:pSer/pThr/pTyr-binding forkhead associated (FHA) protein|nr:FHA domain-containing protein [Planctomycetaceae bacterium]